jgi:hypothetical protein
MMKTDIHGSFRNSITSSSKNCTAESKEILSLVESAIHFVDKTRLLSSYRVAIGVNDTTNKRHLDEQRNDLSWNELEEFFPVSSKATKKRKMSNDSLNMKDKKNDKWSSMFFDLKAYQAEHGDCLVPRGYLGNKKLASWVAEQRKQYKLLQDGKTSSITPERIVLLNDINFAWRAQEAAWLKHYKDLVQYKETFGDCMVSLYDENFPQLGLWVKEQRRHYSLLMQNKGTSHMTLERVQILSNIGFCWASHEATWWQRYKELQQFKEREGTCKVPTKYPPNPKLGTWVHHQRRQYNAFKQGKQSHMTLERIRMLEMIGFVWSSRNTTKSQSESTSGIAANQNQTATNAAQVSNTTEQVDKQNDETMLTLLDILLEE